MKVGLVQLNVTEDPAANLPVTIGHVATLFRQGADLVCTPEMTGFITTDGDRLTATVADEAADETLASLREAAKAHRGWISVGSLAVTQGEKCANRSFMIDPEGEIVARYDKIHMFDVAVSDTETYRESARYQAGDRAVLVNLPKARVGITICYDVRFAHLYRALAQSGADILLVPSAFSPVTGVAHWETLLRARAIETGCYVIAAAQTGQHVTGKRPRATYGHGLVVSPWGEVLLDMGVDPGIATVDLDLTEVAQARKRIPALLHDRPFSGP